MSNDAGFGFVDDCQRHWQSMPAFDHQDLTPMQSVIVHFATEVDRQAFAELVERKITERTQSIWYPQEGIDRYATKRYAADKPRQPRYPIYIPSKGRWESRLTAKAFDKIGVPYKVVVEPQEADAYADAVGPDRVLILPFSNLGKGSIPARNWIWDHAKEQGVERYWTFDDNIKALYRFNNNLKVPIADGTILAVMEDFVERYKNVPIAGMNYFMFASRKTKMPPYYLNTRVYSNMLIQTGLDLRWRGKYNEDTDLSLRVLKDGLCTVLFNAFLIEKTTTMTMKGGNTDELYKQGEGFDGRLAMAESLKEQHPDVTTVTRKWGRWQHHVDYSRFAKNKLIRASSKPIPPGPDEHGMRLRVYDANPDRNADAVELSNGRPKLIIVGQAPGKQGDGRPMEGRAGRRLADLMGLSFDDYLRLTERVNLFKARPEHEGKGDGFPVAEARKLANAMRPQLEGRRVILAGFGVAKAFGLDQEPLRWQVGLGHRVAVVPHPSGVNRWWNDFSNVEAAERFLGKVGAKLIAT